MTENTIPQSFCPYCASTILIPSMDHIFPQFLGGKKKVLSCKPCNDKFGHTFEANSAKILQALHVSISRFGVPLRSVSPTWKEAYIEEGKTYDISLNESGTFVKLSNPIFEFSEDGRIKTAQFSNRTQAEKLVSDLVKKGKGSKNIRIEKVEEKVIVSAFPAIEIGVDLRLLSLKLCTALSTLLSDFDLKDITDSRKILMMGNQQLPIDNVLIAFDSYSQLDSYRNALSHVIYIERNKRCLYGVVQFFGVFQLYSRLGVPSHNSEDTALLATLDPVTGEEAFTVIPVLNLVGPPSYYLPDEFTRHSASWIEKLREEALKRGAKMPDLKMSSVKFQTNISTTMLSPNIRCATDTLLSDSFTFNISGPKLRTDRVG